MNATKKKDELNVDIAPNFEPVGNGWELPDFDDERWNEITYGEFWIPEREGDHVIGKIKDFKEGLYGTFAILETANGEIVNTPSHVILQRKLEMVKPGEIVKIVYRGEKPTSRGRDVKDYDVFVRR